MTPPREYATLRSMSGTKPRRRRRPLIGRPKAAIEDLNDVVLFARVVEQGGITAASALLGVPKATLSRRMTELEARLGIRLLERTSRALRPTEVGRLYYERCRRIVLELEEATAVVQSVRGKPRGRLRVTAPLLLGRTLMGPLVAELRRRYPEIRVFVDATNRHVELVEEEFDVAIRVGGLPDSSLVARRLGTASAGLFAGPPLLARAGRVREPQELSALPLVLLGRGLGPVTLELASAGEVRRVEVDPVVVTTDVDVALATITAGECVGLLPSFALVGEGRPHGLSRVLPQWRAPAVPIHALYASHKGLAPSIKAFLELAHERLGAWLAEDEAASRPAMNG